MDRAIVNWAGNIAYGARALHFPRSTGELQEIVAQATRLRALGSRHSFNRIADTTGDLVSLARLDRVLALDAAARTVTVEGGITYGQLGPALHAAGFALHNLASLPHIGVAGAIATATHGSGERHGNLATAVRALTLVTAGGDLLTLRRGDAEFDGAVVSLGALGIVSAITLDIQPGFDISQTVYTGLPVDAFLANFDAIAAAAYSVSVFTMWQGDTIDQVWLKALAGATPHRGDFFGAAPATRAMHPIATVDPAPATGQMGVPGPWHERLPHFRPAFMPSAGAELQSEYFVPRAHALDAFRALRALQHRIAPHLLVCEIRMVAADEQWLSMAYRQDSVAFHFTWKQDWPAVATVLPEIEAALAPFGVRPHWGKLFTLPETAIRAQYERLGVFRAFAGRLDPAGKFRNAFLDRILFGAA